MLESTSAPWMISAPELSTAPTIAESASSSSWGDGRRETQGYVNVAASDERPKDAGRGEKCVDAVRAYFTYAYNAHHAASESVCKVLDISMQLVAEMIVASARASGWTSALESMKLSEAVRGRIHDDDSVRAQITTPACDSCIDHHMHGDLTDDAAGHRSLAQDCATQHDDPSTAVADRDSALLPGMVSRTETAAAALELCIRHPPAHLSSSMLPILLDATGLLSRSPTTLSAGYDRSSSREICMLSVASMREQRLSQSTEPDIDVGTIEFWKHHLLKAGVFISRWLATTAPEACSVPHGDNTRQPGALMTSPSEPSSALDVEEACVALASTLLTAPSSRSREARQVALARLSYVSAIIAPKLEARTAPAPSLFGSAHSNEAPSNLRVAMQLGLLPPSSSIGDGDDLVEGLEPVVGLKADAIYWTSHYSWFRWFASGCETSTPATHPPIFKGMLRSS